MSIYFYILFFILLFWLVGSLWWYMAPHTMLGVEYESNNEIKDFEDNYLIIASHYYNTVDAMIMCNESRKSQKTINIVAEFSLENSRDIYNQFWKSFPIYTPYKRINLYKGQKNNIVEKSIERLENDENVLMFLNKKNKSKGIYHILKNFVKNKKVISEDNNKRLPILFVKIYKEGQDLKEERKDNDHINSFKGKKFNLEYEEVKDYPIDKSPEEFMEWVKGKLYN
jgi:hypothetical protein